MNFPHITSRVNGMKIPLQRGQAGIMHRFTQPENRLIIAKVDEQGASMTEPERMVIASDTTDNGTMVAPVADNNAALAEARAIAQKAEAEAAELRAKLDALTAKQPKANKQPKQVAAEDAAKPAGESIL